MSSTRRRAVAVALAVAAAAVAPTTALGVQGDFFQPSTSPEAVGFTNSLAVSSFNGDAHLDLASGNGAILLGDGTGNFTPAATSPETVGTGSNAVIAGSLGGDANFDLAVANSDSNDVTILLGDGTGNFNAPGTSPEAAGGTPISVAARDFNNDTKFDLAVANFLSSNGTVTILLGDGTGNFTAPMTSPEPVGNAPQSVVASTFNGDGFIDLAVANTFSDNVTILLGDGTGNFSAADTSPETVAPGDGPVSIFAADLGDSAGVDLAVANAGTDDVTVLLGDGTGNFTHAAGTPEPAGDAPRAMVAANLAGDLNLDLAVGNRLSDDVSILLGDGSGNFTAAPSSPEVTGDDNEGIVAASLGGTASTDLATANGGSGIAILLNDFVPPAVIPPVTTPVPPKAKCKKKKGKKRAVAAAKCKKKKKKK